jgi:hypothetical protein
VEEVKREGKREPHRPDRFRKSPGGIPQHFRKWDHFPQFEFIDPELDECGLDLRRVGDSLKFAGMRKTTATKFRTTVRFIHLR